MTTGIGFVSFSALIPLILRNHINVVFWRWVTLPPLFLPCDSFAFLPVNMKDSMAAETGCTGGCRGEKRQIERQKEGEREREGGGRGRWRSYGDGLISTSSSYSSKPASRLQRLGRTRHVPSRAELPVCGQDFPRGPRGLGQSGGTKKTIMQTEGKGVQGHKCTLIQTATALSKMSQTTILT